MIIKNSSTLGLVTAQAMQLDDFISGKPTNTELLERYYMRRSLIQVFSLYNMDCAAMESVVCGIDCT